MKDFIQPKKHDLKSAFTLVELAIVLVIIGLLAGGVLAGQELIMQAGIRSQIAQFEEINRAALTFQTKYNAIPGDFNKAALFWGAKSNCMDARIDKLTCGGNQNGGIGIAGNSMGSYDEVIERFLFWEHLDNAELIKQNFRQGLDINTIDTNNIESKLAENIHLSVTAREIYIEPSLENKSKNMFVLGAITNGEDYLALDPAIEPETAYNIDSKLDDGMPSTGIVSTEVAFYGNTRCRDGSTPPKYDIAHPGNTCALLIDTNF